MARYRYSDSLPESNRRAERARGLRRVSTPPERVLWSKLRGRRLGGLKFRRQHPVGPYVLDFYCEAARLAVEVDGEVHSHTGERDRRRDAWLGDRGVEVLRIPVPMMMKDMDAALRTILARAERRLNDGGVAGTPG